MILDIRYIAGLFDGEGFIYIRKRIRKRKRKDGVPLYQLAVGLNMCYRPIIEAINSQFGGSIHGHRNELRNSNHRTAFQWWLFSNQAASFLKEIRPYSIIKKEEIDVGLTLQSHINETDLGQFKYEREEISSYREKLYLECKALKSSKHTPLLIKDLESINSTAMSFEDIKAIYECDWLSDAEIAKEIGYSEVIVKEIKAKGAVKI